MSRAEVEKRHGKPKRSSWHAPRPLAVVEVEGGSSAAAQEEVQEQGEGQVGEAKAKAEAEAKVRAARPTLVFAARRRGTKHSRIFCEHSKTRSGMATTRELHWRLLPPRDILRSLDKPLAAAILACPQRIFGWWFEWHRMSAKSLWHGTTA